MRSIRGDQVKNFGSSILTAVDLGLNTPDARLPVWPSSRMPAKKDVLIADMLFAVMKVFAYEADLATELVGTRDDVQTLVRVFREEGRDKSALPLLHGWRWQIAGQHLWAILQNKPFTITCDERLDPPVQIDIIT